MHQVWQREEYWISTDKSLIKTNIVHSFLCKESYWAQGISKEKVEKSIENSTICFGVYKQNKDEVPIQVGFARVVSDLTIFAYLADVFIIKDVRGEGLGKWLVEVITEQHPDLKGIKRFLLATEDAHSLYHQFGFKGIEKPERFLEKVNQNFSRDC